MARALMVLVEVGPSPHPRGSTLDTRTPIAAEAGHLRTSPQPRWALADRLRP